MVLYSEVFHSDHEWDSKHRLFVSFNENSSEKETKNSVQLGLQFRAQSRAHFLQNHRCILVNMKG